MADPGRAQQATAAAALQPPPPRSSAPVAAQPTPSVSQQPKATYPQQTTPAQTPMAGPSVTSVTLGWTKRITHLFMNNSERQARAPKHIHADTLVPKDKCASVQSCFLEKNVSYTLNNNNNNNNQVAAAQLPLGNLQAKISQGTQHK